MNEDIVYRSNADAERWFRQNMGAGDRVLVWTDMPVSAISNAFFWLRDKAAKQGLEIDISPRTPPPTVFLINRPDWAYLYVVAVAKEINHE